MQHDPEAFAALYDRHLERVYRHIRYRVESIPEAEDLTQQTFLQAWRAIHRYRKGSSPFLAWLLTIAGHLVIDHYRRSRKESPLEAALASQALSADPERAAEMGLFQQQVRIAIATLPPEQQQVVMMRFIDGLGYPEIASALGKKEGAVRVIQYRALRQLRTILEKGQVQLG